jgi:hypothetical protein
MGGAEIGRIRARGPRVIIDRPWGDAVPDDVVIAVHRKGFGAGTVALGATLGDPESRAFRVEALAKASVG